MFSRLFNALDKQNVGEIKSPFPEIKEKVMKFHERFFVHSRAMRTRFMFVNLLLNGFSPIKAFVNQEKCSENEGNKEWDMKRIRRKNS